MSALASGPLDEGLKTLLMILIFCIVLLGMLTLGRIILELVLVVLVILFVAFFLRSGLN